MIKEVKITNFYSFKDTAIKIEPDTNIIIGINGSGKSNFLKAIRLLKEGVAGIGLRNHVFNHLGGFDNFYFKGANAKNKQPMIELEYTFDAHKLTANGRGFRFTDDIIYRITLIKSESTSNYYVKEKITNHTGFVYLDFANGAGHLTELINKNSRKTALVRYDDYDSQELVLREVSDNDRYFALTTLKKAIKEIMVYDYFDTTPKSPIRKPMLPTSEKRLLEDGTNLPQILNTIKINHKPAYHKIVEMLKEVNPNFSGFDFNMIGGNIELMLEEASLLSSIHVSNISDGTLRYLCLLAILFNPEQGSFICIDEPEVGLHPDMILNVANAIKDASKNATLVISTHSDSLLDHFDITNVRVFEKDEDNATIVNSYTAEQFEDWYDDFTLGKMWKQGDLGGVRYGN